jgi:CIC family chloride channel protein
MGVVGGLVAVFFTKFLYATEEFFERMKNVPEFVKPALGGLLMGAMALIFPELYGFDDHAIHTALVVHTEVWVLFLLMLFKIFATSLSLGSGGSGGLFTPSLFIGATFGAFFGSAMNIIFPHATASPGAYALVGMGIMIAGTTHATISAMMLIFEITSNYQVILPLMLGTIIATITARLIMRENIYTMKIALSGEYIFKGRNMTLLQSIPIRQHIQKKFDKVPEDMPFVKILDLLRRSDHATFPVVDKKGNIVGIISLRDIRPYMFEQHVYPLLIAKDIAQEDFMRVHPDQSLADVLRLFDLTDAEMLPVTERRDPRRLVGVIYRDELMRWYRKAPLLQQRKGVA